MTGRCDQFRHLLAASLGPHVDRHRSLALVETCPVEAAALVQGPTIDIDAATWRIDPNHVRTERGKGGPAERSRDEGRDLDHAQAGEDRRPFAQVSLPRSEGRAGRGSIRRPSASR